MRISDWSSDVCSSDLQMVAFRFLQGIFAAFIGPLSQSVMLDINPPERHARAMSIWGMGIMIGPILGPVLGGRSEEHTSELQSLMRISYAVFCLKKKNDTRNTCEYDQNRTQHK